MQEFIPELDNEEQQKAMRKLYESAGVEVVAMDTKQALLSNLDEEKVKVLKSKRLQDLVTEAIDNHDVRVVAGVAYAMTERGWVRVSKKR